MGDNLKNDVIRLMTKKQFGKIEESFQKKHDQSIQDQEELMKLLEVRLEELARSKP
jgi:hypothetical protein